MKLGGGELGGCAVVLRASELELYAFEKDIRVSWCPWT